MKRRSTGSNYVDPYNFMVEMYNEEAQKTQVTGVSKGIFNIPIKKTSKEVAEDKEIKQGGYITQKDLKYSNAVKEVQMGYGEENFSERLRRKLTEWLSEKEFDYFVTYRPLRTKITKDNAPAFFYRVMLELEKVKDLYYVIERDWNGSSNHCHILIGGKVDVRQLSKAMKRSEKEIKYFEPIREKEDAVKYVNKYINRDSMLRAYDYLNRKKQIQELENRWWLDTMSHRETIDTHPSREIHRKAQRVSERVYGWGKQKDRFQDKKIIVNYDRKKGVEVTKIPVNPKREAIVENMRESL